MSYWDVLPPEIQVYVLRLRDNQALIEHRESVQSRDLCDEIYTYGLLRDKWKVGHIEVKPKIRYFKSICDINGCKCCGWVERSSPRIFGYVDSNGKKQRVFFRLFV